MSFNCYCRDFENLEKSNAMGCCFMGASDGWSDSKSTKFSNNQRPCSLTKGDSTFAGVLECRQHLMSGKGK